MICSCFLSLHKIQWAEISTNLSTVTFSAAEYCCHTEVHVGGIHMRDTMTKLSENIIHNLPPRLNCLSIWPSVLKWNLTYTLLIFLQLSLVTLCLPVKVIKYGAFVMFCSYYCPCHSHCHYVGWLESLFQLLGFCVYLNCK